ncbi:von Willebrand factor A domain-containing protein 5A-like [Lithobates pipiens]
MAGDHEVALAQGGPPLQEQVKHRIIEVNACASVCPVPLQGIWVDVQVKGFVADVSATLKYKNKEEKAVEAIFVFPMDEDSAVYSFEATIERKKIVAELQEKKQAKETYDEAISQGQQAFLLEEDESSGDIFSISVGNLPPGQEAEVTMNYVRELSVEADGAVCFVLPAVLNPRYTPKGEKVSITATLPNVPISDLPYTLSLKVQFQSAYGIHKIESPCNITPIQYTNEDKTEAKVSLAEGHKFDRDVEILVYYNEVNRPSVTLESGLPDAAEGSFMAYPVAMLNFYPSFPKTQEQSKCVEFIYVVDRSGSMDCPMNSEPNAPMRIQSAKISETLVLLLKSLPLGCYFNIYGFGSTFESLFMESMEYTQETLEAAVDKVNQMSADLGGTEILEPLKKIYKTAGRPKHPRQVFIFTDGEVGNTQQVISEVQRNAHSHRCFTFGIGEGASTALIKGMARVASGNYDFITGKDRLQPKVLKALKCALQPTIKEISLNWTLPPDVEQNLVSQAPTVIFQGQRSIVYVQFKGKLEKEARVSLQYNYKDEIVTNELQFPLKTSNVERPTIHRLAAKNLISFLESDSEESEEVKKRILETSLQSGVVSSLTVYVAVNKDTKTRVEGPPVQRFMPPVAMARSCMPPPGVFYSATAPMSAPVQILEMADFAVGPDIVSLSNGAPQVPPTPVTVETPALYRLIALQKADGSWEASSEFATILGIPENFAESCPVSNVGGSVWATALAVIWLHSSCLDQRDEWELLEGKAVSWVKDSAGSSLAEVVKAGNEFLKSSVDFAIFGL